ncbi:MAG: GNAT family N-acetyltransferase [Thalassobius sp.]|nr:GNAT family N-acetyltransferase [Thalassovita sp.]
MEITSANLNDLAEILELQKNCYLDEAKIYNNYKIPPLTQSLESVRNEFEKGIILKITENERIIGSVRGYADNDTCKIGKLIVDRDFRNKGLGSKLMHEIESRFESVNRFELFTGHKSEKNLSLYHKLGYLEFKREPIDSNLELVYLEKLNK